MREMVDSLTSTNDADAVFVSCSSRSASEQCDCIMLCSWLDISKLYNKK